MTWDTWVGVGEIAELHAIAEIGQAKHCHGLTPIRIGKSEHRNIGEIETSKNKVCLVVGAPKRKFD